MRDAFEQVDRRVPLVGNRIGIFYSDVGRARDARKFMQSTASELNGRGFTFQDVFTQRWLKDNGIKRNGKGDDSVFYKAIYRYSKGRISPLNNFEGY